MDRLLVLIGKLVEKGEPITAANISLYSLFSCGGTFTEIEAQQELNKLAEVDLFEYLEQLPRPVQQVIAKFEKRFEEGTMDGYKSCALLVSQLEKLGFTCDYGLDAEPFYLKILIKI